MHQYNCYVDVLFFELSCGTVVFADILILLTYLLQTFSILAEEGTTFDFRGIRLDWFRLQAYATSNRTGLNLKKNRELAALINQIVFHTKMVDYLDEMLIETSDLSIFW